MANPIEKWFKIIDYDLLTDLQLAFHLGRQGKVVENEILSENALFWAYFRKSKKPSLRDMKNYI